MLLSLVAHAVRYKMMVGVHNTVVVRCMWEVASSSSGMADVGACHTVDAQWNVGGFTVFAWYESLRASITLLTSDACGRLCRLLLVWQMSVPAILLMPRGM